MQYRVINLARTPERLATFTKNNPNFTFQRFNAIDGSRLDRQKLLINNLVTVKTQQRYTAGALGVAMSHRALWQECAQGTEPMTILEDDAYLVPNFNDTVNTITQKFNNWDFIFWGANLDQPITAVLSPSIAAAEIKFNQAQVLANIQNITTQNDITPVLYKCLWAVGLMCYSITPITASYLLKNIFPLRDYFDFRDNFGIDNSIIEELANMRSFISLPPIAITENDRSVSTVQTATVTFDK